MPSSLTKLQVWNLAVDLIEEPPLQSLNDVSDVRRWLERNFDHVVDVSLRRAVWNFAKVQFSLNAEATPPGFGWTYAYKPPGGWLRILPLTYQGQLGGAIIKHQVFGDSILTNEAAPLRGAAIMRISNTGLWDPMFTEVVRCALAFNMANKFTGKNGYIDRTRQMLADALDAAMEVDAIEGTADPVDQHDIIRVRGMSWSDSLLTDRR